jgi:hypothetical protein
MAWPPKGADAAFYDLGRESLLREAGAGLEAALVTDTTALARARRVPMVRDSAATWCFSERGSGGRAHERRILAGAGVIAREA